MRMIRMSDLSAEAGIGHMIEARGDVDVEIRPAEHDAGSRRRGKQRKGDALAAVQTGADAGDGRSQAVLIMGMDELDLGHAIHTHSTLLGTVADHIQIDLLRSFDLTFHGWGLEDRPEGPMNV